MSGVSPCGWSACCGNRPLPLLCRGPWCMCHGFSLGFRKTSHNRKIQDEFEDVVLRCPKIFEEKNSTQLLNDLKIPNGPFWGEDVSFLTFFVQGKKGRYSKKSAHRLEHHHQHTMAFFFQAHEGDPFNARLHRAGIRLHPTRSSCYLFSSTSTSQILQWSDKERILDMNEHVTCPDLTVPLDAVVWKRAGCSKAKAQRARNWP